MGIFDNKKKKNTAKQLGMTVEQYDRFLSVKDRGLSVEEFRKYLKSYADRYSLEQYISMLDMQRKGFSEGQSERYIKEFSGWMQIEDYSEFLKAEAMGMSLEEYIEYCGMYRSALSLQEYAVFLKIENPCFTVVEYGRYLKEFLGILSLEEFSAYLTAEKEGLTHDICIEYAKEYRTIYSIERFIDFDNARSQGMTLEQYDRRDEGTGKLDPAGEEEPEYSKKAEAMDLSLVGIEFLGLQNRYTNILLRAGIDTVGKLMKLTKKELEAIPHLGTTGAYYLRQKIQELSLLRSIGDWADHLFLPFGDAAGKTKLTLNGLENVSVRELDISLLAKNSLQRAGINTIAELNSLSEADLRAIPYFSGTAALREIRMHIAKYRGMISALSGAVRSADTVPLITEDRNYEARREDNKGIPQETAQADNNGEAVTNGSGVEGTSSHHEAANDQDQKLTQQLQARSTNLIPHQSITGLSAGEQEISQEKSTDETKDAEKPCLLGKEPEHLRQQIVQLCGALDAAYPDKRIIVLHQDHKELADAVIELYPQLGYPDAKAFLKAYGYAIDGGFYYPPGKEPERLRQRIVRLCEKLDSAYPDKLLIRLYQDHKQWTKTAGELYRQLGYPNARSFLEAYGYTFAAAKIGRPAKDLTEVVRELKKRYPNGSGMTSVQDLKKANLDISPSIKTLENEAYKMFGMKLSDYLVQEGVLIRKAKETAGPDSFEILKQRYKDKPFMGTLKELREKNADLNWYEINKVMKGTELVSTGHSTMFSFLVEMGILAEHETKPSGDNAAEEKTQLKSIEEKLNEVIQILQERSRTQQSKPETVKALCSANPDLQLSQIGSWISKVHGKKTVEYLAETGILRDRRAERAEWAKKEMDRLAAMKKAFFEKAENGSLKIIDASDYKREKADIVSDWSGFREYREYKGILFSGRSVKDVSDVVTGLPETTPVKIILPEGITSIDDYAFRGVNNLWSISLPRSLKSISKGAFCNCRFLHEVVLPAGVESVGDEAFLECRSLERLKIEGNKVKLGHHSFWYCDSLEEVECGELKTMTDFDPFGMCDKLSLHSVATLFLSQSDWEILRFCERRLSESPDDVMSALISAAKDVGSEEAFIRTAEYLVKNVRNISLDTIQSYLAAAEEAEQTEAMKMVTPLAEAFQKTESNVLEYCRKYFSEGLLDRAFQKIMPEDDWFGEVRYKDSDDTAPEFVVKCAVVPYMEQQISWGSFAYENRFKINGDSDLVAAELDLADLTERIERMMSLPERKGSQRQAIMIPYCRFASGKQIDQLIAQIKDWKKQNSQSGINISTASHAVLLSDSQEAMRFAYRDGLLEEYADMRGLNKNSLLAAKVSDFGFDENGIISCDVGENSIEVILNSDNTLSFFDVKSQKRYSTLPVRNADHGRSEELSRIVRGLRRDIPYYCRKREELLFEGFLFDSKEAVLDSQSWTKLYIQNPVFRKLAERLVWKQGKKRFTVRGTGLIDSYGAYCSLNSLNVRVAHPIDMESDEQKRWISYFEEKGLEQPFEQLLEPVYLPENIKIDRYKGIQIPRRVFSNLERMIPEVELQNSDLEFYFPGGYGIAKGFSTRDVIEFQEFHYTVQKRAGNHVIFCLDSSALEQGIIKDDIAAILLWEEELLRKYTPEQLSELIKSAQEHEANNALAMLIEYKKKRFPDYDAMNEFVLDF